MVLDLFAPAQQSDPGSTKPRTVVARPSAGTWGDRGGPACAELRDLALVFSARLRRSWRLEKPRTAQAALHVPRRLQDAPEVVWEALGGWVKASSRPAPGSRRKAKESARIVFDWMGVEGDERLPASQPRGKVHDLQPLFDRLNREHFQGSLRALVRWSPRPGGLSTHREVRSDGATHHVITIGQLYDHKDVPVYAVEGVLFHEMLHIVHPPLAGTGAKRIVHHRRFREAERAFPGFERWREWEGREVPRLLRSLRRRTRR